MVDMPVTEIRRPATRRRLERPRPDHEQAWTGSPSSPVLPSSTARRILHLTWQLELGSRRIEQLGDRLRSEEQNRQHIQRSAQQTATLECLGHALAGIAHDFNNLLAGVMGRIQLVMLACSSGGVNREDLEEAVRTAQCAANLARQLLSLSRNETAEHGLLDLDQVVVAHLPVLRTLVGRGVELRFDAGLGGVQIRGDVTAIGRVLINLAANARDAMDGEGRITVQTSVERQTGGKTPGTEGARTVVLTVADTGCGIPCDEGERVFEPYFTTKGSLGTGLGLQVVRDIVHHHQGCVTVSSPPGGGACFELRFPAGR